MIHEEVWALEWSNQGTHNHMPLDQQAKQLTASQARIEFQAREEPLATPDQEL